MTTFGLQIPGFALGGGPDIEMFDRTLEHAQAAEASGYESLWVMDHFWQLPPLGGPDAPILEGYTLLGALAARTERLKLGTLVTGVTYRNPALVAKIVTTLDVISHGRAILGIGAAWYDVEHEGLGFDFPSTRERFERLEEAVQICRAMFRAERPTIEGKHYTVRDARNVPAPVQEGGIPIMIGGSGEKKTLKLVAQYADMCNVSGSAATMHHKFDVLRAHCETVGRDPSEITKTRMGTLVLAADAEQAEQTRSFLSQAAGEAFDEQFTVGTADEVVKQVEELAGTGVDVLIFNMPLSDAETVARAGELLTSHFA